MKRILDKSFKYVPAAATDVAATFRRIRQQMKKADAKPTPPNVTNFKKRTA